MNNSASKEIGNHMGLLLSPETTTFIKSFRLGTLRHKLIKLILYLHRVGHVYMKKLFQTSAVPLYPKSVLVTVHNSFFSPSLSITFSDRRTPDEIIIHPALEIKFKVKVKLYTESNKV